MTHPPSEFELIARYFAPMAGEGALGLLDDAAFLTPTPGCDLVLTQDALVAGIHFFPDDPPGSIARKALRVNLSDLAAKGAMARGFLLSFSRVAGQDDAWLAAFAAGLAEDAGLYHCPLLGGDTVRANGPFFLSITAIGEVPSGQMVQRQAGSPGDRLYVSGTIGDSALGLQARLKPDADWLKALSPEERVHLLDRYLHPQPRLVLASSLRAFASAAMDISDGLIGDCDKLCAGAGRVMQAGQVPLSPASRAAIAHDPSLLITALTGGDDYEILVAVPPKNTQAFEAAARAAKIEMRAIGVLGERGTPTRWLDAAGVELNIQHRSYDHKEDPDAG